MRTVVNSRGVMLDFDEVVSKMDLGIYEYLVESFKEHKITDQDFYMSYCAMHRIQAEELGTPGIFFMDTLTEDKRHVA